jgi:hypothetical protein
MDKKNSRHSIIGRKPTEAKRAKLPIRNGLASDGGDLIVGRGGESGTRSVAGEPAGILDTRNVF